MKKVKEISLILGVTWIGDLLNQLLPLPIPAGVYGLFLMLALLCTGMVKLADVEGTGNFLLDNMSPMFIPAGAGLIRYLDEIKAVGGIYLLINVISTVIVFLVTGRVAQFVMGQTEKRSKVSQCK